MQLVERRAELGFAGGPELAQARLDAERASVDRARAEAELRLAWLEIARRLGVHLPEAHR